MAKKKSYDFHHSYGNRKDVGGDYIGVKLKDKTDVIISKEGIFINLQKSFFKSKNFKKQMKLKSDHVTFNFGPIECKALRIGMKMAKRKLFWSKVKKTATTIWFAVSLKIWILLAIMLAIVVWAGLRNGS